MTACPVATPPVKDTMSTPGWATRAAPSAASGPLTTFSTPDGSVAGHGRSDQQDGTPGRSAGP